MNERKEALTLAIQNEIKAQNLYRMMAKAFSDEQTSLTFLNLVPLEEMHEDKLLELYRAEFDDEPEIDRKALPDFKVRKDLDDPKNILEFAIEQELIAYAAYKRLAILGDKEEDKALYNELAAEELNHKAMLEERIEQLEGLLRWFDPSELNGLMED